MRKMRTAQRMQERHLERQRSGVQIRPGERQKDQDGREETGRETERPGGQSIGTLPCVLISKMRRHCLYDRVGSYAQITGSPTNHHRVQTHMQKQRDFIQV